MVVWRLPAYSCIVAKHAIDRAHEWSNPTRPYPIPPQLQTFAADFYALLTGTDTQPTTLVCKAFYKDETKSFIYTPTEMREFRQ